jgi:hypothetical protein
MRALDWFRVSRRLKCPLCSKADNCCIAKDGSAIWCGRISDGAIRQNRGGQWLHILDDSSRIALSIPNLQSFREHSQFSPTYWRRFVETRFAGEMAAVKRRELAGRLAPKLADATANALERLGVGYEPGAVTYAESWSIPERNAAGEIIGVSRRFDRHKQFYAGGQRGLCYADGWQEPTGPVLLVEGMSDTAAAMAMEIPVVGRPSNIGGVEHLAELLRILPKSREVLVIGEADRKPHGELPDEIRTRHNPNCAGCASCWPGLHGAVQTADRLSKLLERTIGWAFPPGGSKDLRAWTNAAA